MAVSYIDPAERAWSRTRLLLLQPVEIERWIVIGFAAFVAGLAGQSAGFGFTRRFGFDGSHWGERLLEAPFAGIPGIVRDGSWSYWSLPATALALVVGVLFLWLSSRGKFVFLDDMVHGRASFLAPWRRFAGAGQSLFVWRLCFVAAVLLLVVSLVSPMFWLGRSLGDNSLSRPLGAMVTYGASVGLLVLGALAGYILLLLDCFVVPIMYARDLSAREAWRAFLPLLRNHLPEFLGFGLVVLAGWVGVLLCLIAAGIATCCILPFLLAVPYLRSVLLLPLSGFFRLYGVEFLEQFGPEFVMPATAVAVEPTPPVEPPSAEPPVPPDEP